MRDPCGHILVEFVDLRSEYLGGPLDPFWIAPDLDAPLVKHLVLMRDHVRLALAVPDRGVLSDDPERHLFSAATNEDRQRILYWTRIQLRESIHDDPHIAIEIPQA